MTKKDFTATAKPLNGAIEGQTVLAAPKEFSTGSVGWHLNGKVNVRLPSGEMVKVQVSVSVRPAPL